MKDDYITNSVNGAEGFSRYHHEEEFREWDAIDDLDEDWDSFDDDEKDYDELECNCSDPACPCRGTKRGGL